MNPIDNYNIKIRRCSHGHLFAVLPDHPTTDGKIDCPHCMKIQIIQFDSYIQFMENEEAK